VSFSSGTSPAERPDLTRVGPGRAPVAPASPAELSRLLRERGYVADRGSASALFVAYALRKPLFLEGPSGVGKTELAKAFADTVGGRLIRLQCYEGIDVHQALYDWNYSRQMLYIRALHEGEGGSDDLVRHVFGPDFLIRRPLLDALESDEEVVLLIDEIDRADDEFEAFLLELLSDFQITIPEIGTVKAARRPIVMLTSNRTREVHDALKRRCFYHWIEYPDRAREMEILRARVPDVSESLAVQICSFVDDLRKLNLQKPPGIGETLDWASALQVLGDVDALDPSAFEESMGAVLKVREDQQKALAQLSERQSA
jgi:MoxR-like ATPase